MTDKERLVAWMKANGYSQLTLANATGDARNNISMMLSDERSITDSFKWRFRQALGNEAADAVFGAPQVATPV